jgi:hypothetical protein
MKDGFVKQPGKQHVTVGTYIFWHTGKNSEWLAVLERRKTSTRNEQT